MRADQQDDFCVCVIRAGAIESHPELITLTAPGGTDVCMRVVSVDSPRRKNAFCKTIFAGTAHVIHDFVAPVFQDCVTNPRGDGVECLIPGCAFPFPFATFSSAFEWVKNAVRICYLIQCCRTFSTVATTRAWMFGISFELLYFASDLIDIGQQTTRGFAVEARGWDDRVVPLLPLR